MNREEKKQEVERLKADLTAAETVFVVNFQKMKVSEDQDLRHQVRTAGGSY